MACGSRTRIFRRPSGRLLPGVPGFGCAGRRATRRMHYHYAIATSKPKLPVLDAFEALLPADAELLFGFPPCLYPAQRSGSGCMQPTLPHSARVVLRVVRDPRCPFGDLRSPLHGPPGWPFARNPKTAGMGRESTSALHPARNTPFNVWRFRSATVPHDLVFFHVHFPRPLPTSLRVRNWVNWAPVHIALRRTGAVARHPLREVLLGARSHPRAPTFSRLKAHLIHVDASCGFVAFGRSRREKGRFAASAAGCSAKALERRKDQ